MSNMESYREAYADGFRDGMLAAFNLKPTADPSAWGESFGEEITFKTERALKRKKSAWQKYMANKRNQIKYKSGSKKGRLNLKAMGVQYRKKKRR